MPIEEVRARGRRYLELRAVEAAAEREAAATQAAAARRAHQGANHAAAVAGVDLLAAMRAAGLEGVVVDGELLVAPPQCRVDDPAWLGDGSLGLVRVSGSRIA